VVYDRRGLDRTLLNFTRVEHGVFVPSPAGLPPLRSPMSYNSADVLVTEHSHKI